MRGFKRSGLIALFLSLWISAAANADWIDVKGEGAMNGKVVGETAETVSFRDGSGQVREFRRDQINFMEKDGKKARTAARSAAGSAGSAGATVLKDFIAEDSPLKPAENVLSAVTEMFRDYLCYDADVLGFVESAARDLGKLNKDSTFAPKSLPLAAVGSLLILTGFVGIVIYGFKLMMKMFEAGFFWGLIFILNAASAYFSRLISGPAGLAVASVLPALFLLSVIVHWQAARRAVTMQLYCMAALIGGWYAIALSVR